MSSSSLKDRTGEFRSLVESIRLRSTSSSSSHHSDVRKPLLPNTTNGKGQRSQFASMAAKIGKDIQGTTFKMEKLAQLAKRKTLFDDRPVEISVSLPSALLNQQPLPPFTNLSLSLSPQELTYIIKQDIAALNQQIAQLQSFTRSQLNTTNNKNGVGAKQVSEHNNNVVMMLQSKLADTSIGFKDVLEIRTANMNRARDRTEQFMYPGSSSSSTPSSVLRSRPSSLRSDSPLYQSSLHPTAKGKGRENNNYGQEKGADFTALDLGGPGVEGSGLSVQGYQEQELVGVQDQYLSQRSSAIETIESTVAELGQIFSQLATMVAQQGEMITSIDHDTHEISNNVQGAQTELLRYYASVSSNRWLMFKVFGVLIAFFLIFILVS